MAALGSDRAANVLQLLGEDEIESLSLEMAKLSPVAPETTDAIFSEIAARRRCADAAERAAWTSCAA